MKKLMIFLLVILTSIILVSADFGYNNLGVPQLPPEINYSKLIVNLSTNYSDYSGYATNSGQLEGRYTSTLVTYLQGLYDLVYCKLTGCTMAGDIDMGGNDITNAGNITADTYFGDGSQLTGIDFTPYWKSDGTSTATGNWDIGTNSFNTSRGISLGSLAGGNLLFNLDQAGTIGTPSSFAFFFANLNPSNKQGANPGAFEIATALISFSEILAFSKAKL